ncbi:MULTISPECIES: ketol-acid reductoisomerase [Methanothermobacter]|jgi:ketol-acid reductoisomerase|uniref:Ketol-acid reductoisomerase (NADP(+)) n=3 Tax=Methanothermobacter TaxID=145260 RepID=ILVC_METTH|nr:MULTISPECIES: ketol-acid reductoisomerase [Methanothermobacter]O27491.2 RecName: Full=Ketol-acid reductoisomerase (NADP(+)); Short=KARI; AltName: Full=Acetohydroxy-acid isomeroreductase; Short=AHIR; AltName: Full=Alpha-keto-beta-hydroxylacyl reductoisomerase; AltName: Full=Ketol-acid reductoisomerase type 1; AltName: Full=Ketol-acid reductoisomerase type I [Methanothermobacter thermautotrophicus str. Delta H]MBC7110977.1 ketol-acid reductoisomerase [Methanothermobacter sp.]MDN5373433.1 ketol-
MKIYYENDIDMEILADKKIAVIGYGSQGEAQARNMADSGLNVIVGLRRGGSSWKKAHDDGMNVMTIEDASREADIIHILIPDEIQETVFEQSIRPYLKEGNTISFSHGYNIHYGYIKAPEGVNVTMVAPKGPGAMVRRTYLEGFGIPGLVAVEVDATGDAMEQALAMAKACGLARAGVLETTFREETETDLFGEQAVLCGGVTELINTAFKTLVRAGYQPEIAYFETCHELKLIVDLIYERGFRGMWHNVSNTAEFGGLTRRGRIITEETEKEMDEILKEIQNGKFAKEWALENRAGAPMLKRMRKLESELEIEEVGSKLRKLCGLEK